MTDVFKRVEQPHVSVSSQWVVSSPAPAPFSPLTLPQASALAVSGNKLRDLTDASDESLLRQICTGDRDALGILFERYARLTRSVAARILRDTAEAEDLVQDLFLYIQRKCGIFDSSKSTARSWIVQMAYHRALDRRRYLKSREFYAQPIQPNRVQVVGKPTS